MASRKLVLFIFSALLAQVAWAGEAQEFNISQATARAARVKIYFDALDAQGNPASGLQPANFQATLGRETLKLTEIAPFAESGEGVAYIFLIDTSKSLSSAKFTGLREALKSWIAQMNEQDRAAILTFGEAVTLVKDFTADKVELATRLETIELNARRTQLYGALLRALEMGKRSDADLPDRRVIVVLSDGKDEGSGLAVEDVLAKLQQHPLPIYAIGYSSLAGDERQKHLDTLHRFAQTSGGLFREVDADSLTNIYSLMKGAIGRVFVAKFSCDNCPANGESQRLQIKLTQDGRAFSDGLDIQLFPDATPTEPARIPEARPWWRPDAGWAYGLAGLGLLALAGAGWRWRRKRSGFAPTDSQAPGYESAETEALSGKPVRLTQVSGYNAGQAYHLQLGNRFIIGRREDCDLALIDESVSGQHCELSHINGRVVIQDLHSMNGTEVNGITISGRHRLESGDTIIAGDTQLRITFEE